MMRNIPEYIIWRNYWGKIDVLSLLETVTKQRESGQAPGIVWKVMLLGFVQLQGI